MATLENVTMRVPNFNESPFHELLIHCARNQKKDEKDPEQGNHLGWPGLVLAHCPLPVSMLRGMTCYQSTEWLSMVLPPIKWKLLKKGNDTVFGRVVLCICLRTKNISVEIEEEYWIRHDVEETKGNAQKLLSEHVVCIQV